MGVNFQRIIHFFVPVERPSIPVTVSVEESVKLDYY